jgi:hypothetical protein
VSIVAPLTLKVSPERAPVAVISPEEVTAAPDTVPVVVEIFPAEVTLLKLAATLPSVKSVELASWVLASGASPPLTDKWVPDVLRTISVVSVEVTAPKAVGAKITAASAVMENKVRVKAERVRLLDNVI